jgi:hypothetical protein
LVSIPTWQNAMAFSIQPGQLHNYRDTTGTENEVST